MSARVARNGLVLFVVSGVIGTKPYRRYRRDSAFDDTTEHELVPDILRGGS